MNIVEIVVYVLVAVTITLLFFSIVKLVLSNRKLFARAVQAEMDRIVTMVELEKLNAEKNAQAIEKTDGFLKFISESRDWAFQYIEDVQEAIKEYDAALSKNDPHLMNAAYKKLIDMLPEDAIS